MIHYLFIMGRCLKWSFGIAFQKRRGGGVSAAPSQIWRVLELVGEGGGRAPREDQSFGIIWRRGGGQGASPGAGSFGISEKGGGQGPRRTGVLELGGEGGQGGSRSQEGDKH